MISGYIGSRCLASTNLNQLKQKLEFEEFQKQKQNQVVDLMAFACINLNIPNLAFNQIQLPYQNEKQFALEKLPNLPMACSSSMILERKIKKKKYLNDLGYSNFDSDSLIKQQEIKAKLRYQQELEFKESTLKLSVDDNIKKSVLNYELYRDLMQNDVDNFREQLRQRFQTEYGCDKQTAEFCLEASNYNFEESKKIYDFQQNSQFM